MDWGQVVGDAVLAAGSVVTGVIAKRASRHADRAARIGAANADKIETVRKQTNGRQREMIKEAVEDVARDHPELISEAVANEVVRTVLESILQGQIDEHGPPRRRGEDFPRRRYRERDEQ